jgi:hypothetical protein
MFLVHNSEMHTIEETERAKMKPNFAMILLLALSSTKGIGLF